MDVFDLVAKITLDTSEYEKTLSEKADEIDRGNGNGGKFTKALGGIAKVGAVAFGAVGTAAVTAVSAMAKAAVSGYAEWEQLVGGVNKLYGAGGKTLEEYAASTGQTVDEARGKYNELIQAQNDVLKNADNAYKTSGMSANEYMDTATGFAASLINSLSGDTQKAAQVTDVAMRSMSDNANTFGTDIESIKMSYQGFAKQNYTMLDNLNTMGALAA